MSKRTLFVVMGMFLLITFCYAEDFLLEGDLTVTGEIKGEGEGEIPHGYILEPTYLDFWEGYSEYPFSMRIERDKEELHLYYIPEGNQQFDWLTKTIINGYGLRVGLADSLTVFDSINVAGRPYRFAVDGHAVITSHLRIGPIPYQNTPPVPVPEPGSPSESWDCEFLVMGDSYTQSLKVANNIVIGGGGLPDSYSDYSLAVDGTILTKEVQVKNDENWPDYVFEDNYHLPRLNELESFITSNKHLPNIPTKEEVAINGFNLGEMQAKLLQKIEELTLYIIDIQKQNNALAEKVEELSKKSE